MLTDKSEIIFYEFPKLEKWVKEYEEGKTDTKNLSEDEKWCIFMKYRHEGVLTPLIKELCVKEEGIMRAEQQVAKLDRSFVRYMRNLSAEKDKLDLSYKLGAAYREGKAEEREQWQTVVADKDAEIAQLRKQLEQK